MRREWRENEERNEGRRRGHELCWCCSLGGVWTIFVFIQDINRVLWCHHGGTCTGIHPPPELLGYLIWFCCLLNFFYFFFHSPPCMLMQRNWGLKPAPSFESIPPQKEGVRVIFNFSFRVRITPRTRASYYLRILIFNFWAALWWKQLGGVDGKCYLQSQSHMRDQESDTYKCNLACHTYQDQRTYWIWKIRKKASKEGLYIDRDAPDRLGGGMGGSMEVRMHSNKDTTQLKRVRWIQLNYQKNSEISPSNSITD